MLTLLEEQTTPSADELEILTELIEKFELDLTAIWALIDAFNFGVIKGKQAERKEK